MFNIKAMPSIERKPDGSLPHMMGRQKQHAVRLIRERCSAYDGGNCLYLDDGEEVFWPQTISCSVCCKFFRHVLLHDEDGKTLKAELFKNIKPRSAAHATASVRLRLARSVPPYWGSHTYSGRRRCCWKDHPVRIQRRRCLYRCKG